jgi:hypothetical protein
MVSSFSICCNHFTSLAYEIFYARKVDLFDKIKEVVFSQHFLCVQLFIAIFMEKEKTAGIYCFQRRVKFSSILTVYLDFENLLTLKVFLRISRPLG